MLGRPAETLGESPLAGGAAVLSRNWRLRFVARLLDGEAMSEVCRAFGISRKTGYKIFERYKEPGHEA